MNDTDLVDALNAAVSAEGSDQPAAPAVPESGATGGAPTGTTPETKPRTPYRLTDDDEVEYDLGKGQVEKLTWKDLRAQRLLHRDYTQKTQSLATDRKSYQSERTQFDTQRSQFEAERQALAQALRDPKKIEALYLAVVGGQQPGQGTPPPVAPIDPNAIQQTILQNVRAEMAQERERLVQEQVNSERATTLERHVGAILDANPVLKALPRINEYLYDQVIAMVEPGRTTPEEAQQMLDTVAQGVAGSLSEHFTQVGKQKAVSHAQLQNGIEPRGGAPVMPQAKQYNRRLGLSDPDLERDLIAGFKSSMTS